MSAITMQPDLTQHRRNRNRNRYRSRIDGNHRNRAHFDIHKCTAHIRNVGEENGNILDGV